MTGTGDLWPRGSRSVGVTADFDQAVERLELAKLDVTAIAVDCISSAIRKRFPDAATAVIAGADTPFPRLAQVLDAAGRSLNMDWDGSWSRNEFGQFIDALDAGALDSLIATPRNRFALTFINLTQKRNR